MVNIERDQEDAKTQQAIVAEEEEKATIELPFLLVRPADKTKRINLTP